MPYLRRGYLRSPVGNQRLLPLPSVQNNVERMRTVPGHYRRYPTRRRNVQVMRALVLRILLSQLPGGDDLWAAL